MSEKLEALTEPMLQSHLLNKYLYQTQSLEAVSNSSDGIMVWLGDQVFGAFLREGKWYRMKEAIDPIEALYAIIDRKETANQILNLVKDAITKLLPATCQADVDAYGIKPLVLVNKPRKIN